jgi:hypothetical protein
MYQRKAPALPGLFSSQKSGTRKGAPGFSSRLLSVRAATSRITPFMKQPRRSPTTRRRFQPQMFMGIESHDRSAIKNNLQIIAKSAKLVNVKKTR